MSFVVARRDGRFELRRSEHRPGTTPRARTLATFRVLDDEVLDRAEARAGAPIDRERCRERARAAGAEVASAPPVATVEAHRLLVALRRAALPAPLRAALAAVAAGERPDGPAGWIGAPAADRAATLVDLLGTVDRLPPPRRVAPLDRRLVASPP